MTFDRNNWQLTKNFNLREFEMPETGEVVINPKLVWHLQALRDLIAAPITITSGYRTVGHNTIVGGVTGSQHIDGDAVDVVVDDMYRELLKQCAGQIADLVVLDEGDHIHLAMLRPAAPE